ncbi:MAG: hypothetical protein EA356_02975, partial [Geminicoccaceae bacterium]
RMMKAKLQRLVGRIMPPAVGNLLVPLAMPVTHRFLKGRLAPPATPQPNIIHLTLNKAASQNTAKILAMVLAERNYRTVWPNRYAFFSTTPYFEHTEPATIAANPIVTQPWSVFVAAIGNPIRNEALLDGTRQILAIRDPRDIVTSDYYSRLYFHPEPIAGDKTDRFRARRQHAADLGIDGYALAQAERLREMFDAYARLAQRPTCLGVLRFEDFVDDFENWFTQLERICGLEPSVARRARLGPLAPQRPQQERKTMKVRAGRSGQFRERLQPATIAALDEIFGPVLTQFAYV